MASNIGTKTKKIITPVSTAYPRHRLKLGLKGGMHRGNMAFLLFRNAYNSAPILSEK